MDLIYVARPKSDRAPSAGGARDRQEERRMSKRISGAGRRMLAGVVAVAAIGLAAPAMAMAGPGFAGASMTMTSPGTNWQFDGWAWYRDPSWTYAFRLRRLDDVGNTMAE